MDSSHGGQLEWSPRYRTYSTRGLSICKRSESDDNDDDNIINYHDADADDDVDDSFY